MIDATRSSEKPSSVVFIYPWGDCTFVGVNVGIGFMPQDRVFQKTEQSVDALSLFRDVPKCF